MGKRDETEYLRVLTITVLSLLSRYPHIPMASGIKVNWGGPLPWRIDSEASLPAMIMVWWSKNKNNEFDWVLFELIIALSSVVFFTFSESVQSWRRRWHTGVDMSRGLSSAKSQTIIHCKFAKCLHLHDVCSPSCSEGLTDGSGCQSSY